MPQSNSKLKTILFLTSQGITLFGSSLVQFAIVWYVTLETSSGFWVSLLTVCAYIPQFIISFFAGVWADRHSKKKLIIISDSSIAAATLVLALLMPQIGEGKVLLIALIVTSAIRSVGAGIQTPAVGAMIYELVPKENLMRVNGINSTIQSVVQFAAPAAAGAILTISTLRITLFIDIATAAVGVGILAAISVVKTMKTEEKITQSLLTDLKTGIKYTFSNIFLGRLLTLYGIFIFLCVPAGFLATLFVTRTYGNSYYYMTAVELVGFAGMAAGGLLISIWGGFKSKTKTLFSGIIAFGTLASAMGLVNNFIIYLILMLAYGIALTMVQTSTVTLIQEKSASDMQGRVFGFLGAMYSGFLPLGMAVFGPLADIIPIRFIMIGSGLLLIFLALYIPMNKNFYIAGINKKENGADE